MPDNHEEVLRVGMVVKVKADKLEAYKQLHSDEEPGVRHLLKKYNMRNFSIFLVQLADSNWYEFGYYEYWGDNLDEDMRLLDQEPENKAWLGMCDPMQVGVLPEITGWKRMERIYYNY
jgi:L-rhamnose mutarotase